MVKYFTICRTPEAQIEHTDIKRGIHVTTTYQVFKMNVILQVLSIINLPLFHSVSEVSFQIALFLFLPIYFNHGESCPDWVWNRQGEEMTHGHFTFLPACSALWWQSFLTHKALCLVSLSLMGLRHLPGALFSTLLFWGWSCTTLLPVSLGEELTWPMKMTRTAMLLCIIIGFFVSRASKCSVVPTTNPLFCLVGSWNLPEIQKLRENPAAPAYRAVSERQRGIFPIC